jgi:hypothetical protein
LFHNCASTKKATKKINEVQILRVFAMMRRVSTRDVIYPFDQKGLNETTVHSNG